MQQLDCPSCGSNNTQKVSVVYRAGTTTGTSSSRHDGYTWENGKRHNVYGHSVTDDFHQTSLATRHAPPGQIVDDRVAWFIIGFFVIAIAAFLAAAFSPAASLVVAVIGAIILLTRTLRKTETLRWNQTVWPSLHAEWNRTWVCHRCGETFLPAQSETDDAANSFEELTDEIIEQAFRKAMEYEDNQAEAAALELTEKQRRLIFVRTAKEMLEGEKISDSDYAAIEDYVHRFPNGPSDN